MSTNVWKSAAIGTGCGLLAAGAMNLVPMIWKQFDDEQKPSSGGEDATVKTAEKIAEPVIGRELKPEEKKVGGPAVHFAFGAIVGAIYGALAEVAPVITTGMGTLYGTAVWLLGDELAVPQLGLAPAPQTMPAKEHVKYWAMHAVYGAVLDGSRRLVNETLD